MAVSTEVIYRWALWFHERCTDTRDFCYYNLYNWMNRDEAKKARYYREMKLLLDMEISTVDYLSLLNAIPKLRSEVAVFHAHVADNTDEKARQDMFVELCPCRSDVSRWRTLRRLPSHLPLVDALDVTFADDVLAEDYEYPYEIPVMGETVPM